MYLILVRLTDYMGHEISINFDHVHYYRETTESEKTVHPYAETRIDTDCFSFYVRETPKTVRKAIICEGP